MKFSKVALALDLPWFGIDQRFHDKGTLFSSYLHRITSECHANTINKLFMPYFYSNSQLSKNIAKEKRLINS